MLRFNSFINNFTPKYTISTENELYTVQKSKQLIFLA